MSQVIDERVVEMKFDNKEFEKNIGQSINSLDQLKQALKIEDTSKSIEKISSSLEKINTINFDAINNAATAITKKFSFVGTIIDQLRRNIVNLFTARGVLGNLKNFALDSILGGGEKRAANLAKAKFSLSAIVGEGKQLDAVMTSVGDSVDGTAYSLDEAANVAANLVTIGYRGGEELTNMLKGVAGTASMAGANFVDIGNIFSKVAAKGHLMGDQINQLAYRNINVVELLAKKYGKTGDEITKMVSKGQISFSMFAETLQEAFGEHAAKANETYSGSLANLRSAFARIGADVAATKFEALKDVFNALRPLVNELRRDLQPTINLINKTMLGLSKWSVGILSDSAWTSAIKDISESIYNVMFNLIMIFAEAKEAFAEVFPEVSVKGIATFSKLLKELTERFLLTEKNANRLRRTFRGLFSLFKLITNVFRGFANAIFPAGTLLSSLGDGFLSLTSILGDIITLLAQATENTDVMTNSFKAFGKILGTVLLAPIGAVVLALTTVKDVIEKLIGYLSDGSDSVETFVSELIKTFKAAGGGVEGFMAVLDLLYTKMQTIFAGHPMILTALEYVNKAFLKTKTIVVSCLNTILIIVKELFSVKGVILGFGIATIVLAKNLATLSDAFYTTSLRFNQFMSVLTSTLTSTKGLIDAFKKSLATDNFLKVSVGISLLAATLAALTYVIRDVDLNKFLKITGALAGFVFVVLLLSRMPSSLNGTIVTLVALAGSIAMIAAVFKMFEAINFGGTKKVIKEIGLLIGMISVLSVLAIALGHFGASSVAGTSELISLSLSLIAIAGALRMLGDMSIENLDEKLVSFGLLLAAMVGLAAYASTMPPWKAGALLATAIAIRITAGSIVTIFNGLDFSGLQNVNTKLEYNWDQFLVLGGTLTLIALSIAKLAPVVTAVGASILSVALGFFLISWTVKNLPTYLSDFVNGMGALATMIVAVGAIMFTVSKIGPFPAQSFKELLGAAAMIMAIGAAMFTISMTAALLSLVDPVTLVAPIITIGAVAAALGFVVERSRNIDMGTAKVIVAITGAMAAIVGLMIVLSVVYAVALSSPAAATAIGAAILSVIGICGLVAWLIRETSKLKGNTVHDLAALIIIFGGIMGLVVSIGIMAKLVKDPAAIGAAGAVVAVIAGLVIFGIIPLMKTLNSFKSGTVNKNVFAQLALLFGGLVTVILAMVPLAMQNAAQITMAGVVVSAFTGVIGVVLYNLLDLLDSFTHKKFNTNVFAQMSVVFLGIIGAVLAMSKLASINGAQIAMAGVVVIGFTGVMSLCLGALLNMFNKFTKKQFNLNAFLQMSAMIAGLVLVINQTTQLAQANPSQILSAGAVVAVLSGVMTGLLILFEKVAKNQNAMISGAGAMLMMSAGISLIAVSVGQLAGYDWDSLGEALSGLGIIIVALGTIITITAAISKDVMAVAGMLAAGGALCIAAVGLATLAAGLSLLAQYDFASIKAACDGMIGVLITLGVIMGILAGISVATEGIGAVVILAVAAALSALGVACGIAAVGIGVAAWGISKLVEALQQLVAFVTANAQGIANSIVTISGGITQALDNIGDAFVRAAQKIATSLAIIKAAAADLGVDFVGGYYSSIMQAVPLLFGAGGAIAASALSGIQTTQDSHSNAKETIALGLDFTGGYMQSLQSIPMLGQLFKAGGDMAQSAADGIRDKNPEVRTAGEFVADSVWDAVKDKAGDFLGLGEGWMANLQNGIAEGGEGAISTAWSIGQRIWAALRGGAAGEWGTDSWSYGDNDSAIIKVAKSQIKDSEAANKLLEANDKKRKTWIKDQVKGTSFEFLADTLDDVSDVFDEVTDAAGDAGKALGGAGGAAKKSGEDAKHALKGWQELESTLSDTIDSQMDIFSEFDKKTELTGEKLLANMRSQVEGVAEWAYNMQKLSARGVNNVLLQELSQLGPQGYEKVNAFMQMTDEQLAEANKLYEQRLALPDAAAEAVVAGFAQAGMWATEGYTNALDYLQAKKAGAEMGSQSVEGLLGPDGIDAGSPSKKTKEAGEWFDEGLDNGLRSNFWLTRIKLAGKLLGQSALEGLMQVLNPNATDMSGTSEAAIGSFIKGIVDTTGNLTDTATSLCQTFLEIFIKELPEEKFFEFGYMVFTKFGEGLIKSNDELSKKIVPAMKKLETTIDKAFTKIGEFAAKGMAKGIEKNIKAITKSTLKATKAAEDAAKGKKGMDERSPSKKFFKIGEYATLGLANGILSASGEAVASMQSVSSEIVTKFQNAVDKVQSMADLDDNALTLTPVLDLSMVEDGLNNATALFNRRTISLGASVDNARLAAAVFDRMQNPAEAVKAEPQTVNNYTTFNQTNTSPKALSNSEVYRQTNNLISKFRNR